MRTRHTLDRRIPVRTRSEEPTCFRNHIDLNPFCAAVESQILTRNNSCPILLDPASSQPESETGTPQLRRHQFAYWLTLFLIEPVPPAKNYGRIKRARRLGVTDDALDAGEGAAARSIRHALCT
jgi:hypothetical protein